MPAAVSYDIPAHAGPEIALESTFEALALITTLLRLFYRIYVQRFWWDDAWALLAMLFSILPYVMFVISMIESRLMYSSNALISFSRLGVLVFYTAALWSAKLSVAVTVVRLGSMTFETFSRRMTYILGACGLALVVQKIFICGTNLKQAPLCAVPTYSGILELTLDLLGDVWLIGGPFYMLYKIKLPRQHHRLISVIFACGFVATIASIVHGYFAINSVNIILMVVSSQIQVAISIVTCNLLVLVTYVYRRVHQGEGTVDRTETPDPSSNGRDVLATQNSQPLSSGLRSQATTHYSLTDIESVIGSNSGYTTSATPSGFSGATGHYMPETQSMTRSEHLLGTSNLSGGKKPWQTQ